MGLDGARWGAMGLARPSLPRRASPAGPCSPGLLGGGAAAAAAAGPARALPSARARDLPGPFPGTRPVASPRGRRCLAVADIAGPGLGLVLW